MHRYIASVMSHALSKKNKRTWLVASFTLTPPSHPQHISGQNWNELDWGGPLELDPRSLTSSHRAWFMGYSTGRGASLVNKSREPCHPIASLIIIFVGPPRDDPFTPVQLVIAIRYVPTTKYQGMHGTPLPEWSAQIFWISPPNSTFCVGGGGRKSKCGK